MARLRLRTSAVSSKESFYPNAEFVYTGHGASGSQLFDERSLFDGDENAIVDFNTGSSPKNNLWFDHHQSAFLTPQDAEHFRQDRTARSCTIHPTNPARFYIGDRQGQIPV